ncbi:DUF551 domain-containing protein [Enterobacter hormaechei]|uniref:DUF551 domain-containing protein n=1 Tax=Enterobacter hormaechei TaxID=158836 RepID=UPI000A45DD8B|nr:DUF551 domain-containing protein [Enterobacter hormaechei]
MSELTKEWLQQTIAELEEERDAVPGAVNEDAVMALAAMKLALASLEANPLGYIEAEYAGLLNSGHIESYSVYAEPGEGCCPVYTAPPAPEFYKIGDATMRHIFTPTGITDVSDMQAVFDQIETVLAGMWQPAPMVDEDLLHMAASAIEDLLSNKVRSGAGVWADLPAKLRRAAMIKGTEPVTTAIKLPFEQWLSQQAGTIDVECGCVMTEVFFHWLRVAYEAGNSPVIPDGWVACSERMPEGMTDVHISNGHDVGQGWWDGDTWQTQHDYYSVPGDVTHWMPMPAAPQQEVK